MPITSFKTGTKSRSMLIGNEAYIAGHTGVRGLFGGGSAHSGGSLQNSVEYITVSTTGNGTDFGDLTLARSQLASCSSNTRGVWAGGQISGGNTNTIDYVTIANIGNATDFGDLTVSRYTVKGCSSSTRGLFAGGYVSDTNTAYALIDYVTIATTGNATTFGDRTISSYAPSQGSGSSTRALFSGGTLAVPPYGRVDIIDYVTIASVGNATDFGDLTSKGADGASCSSSTRALFLGGVNDTSDVYFSKIDYVTIATTGNAANFGDMTVGRNGANGAGSLIRAAVAGGGSIVGGVGVNRSTIEYVTISTLGNGTNFGDMDIGKSGLAGCSNGHGGLAV